MEWTVLSLPRVCCGLLSRTTRHGFKLSVHLVSKTFTTKGLPGAPGIVRRSLRRPFKGRLLPWPSEVYRQM